MSHKKDFLKQNLIDLGYEFPEIRDHLRKILASFPDDLQAKLAKGMLDSKTRSLLNAELVRQGLDGNGRFSSPEDGFSRAWDILASQGIEMDEVISSFRFITESDRFTVDLAFSNPEDPFSPVPIKNAMLVFSFTKLSKYAYDVLAYVS